LGIVIALVLGLYFTWSMVDATRIELDAKTTEIDALKRRIAMPVAPTNGPSDKDVFLPGANYALAANSLQQRLVEMVEQAGGKITTVSVEQPTDEKTPSRRVVVQVRADLDNDGLQSLLYNLETGQPLTLVDSLNVHRTISQSEDVKTDSKRAPRLTVELRV